MHASQQGIRLSLIGHKYGYLTVLYEGSGKGRNTTWVCKCECGKICEKIGAVLRTRPTKRPNPYPSCGQQCPIKIAKHAKLVSTQDGKSKHPVYSTWHAMIQRCYNPRCGSWERYGGRGITVCRKWLHSFKAFWGDMAPSHKAGLEIDRKNSEGNYTPRNCRWATRTQNSRNRKNSLTRTKGFPKDFFDIVTSRGLSRKCFYSRVNLGWSWDEIINTPLRSNGYAKRKST